MSVKKGSTVTIKYQPRSAIEVIFDPPKFPQSDTRRDTTPLPTRTAPGEKKAGSNLAYRVLIAHGGCVEFGKTVD